VQDSGKFSILMLLKPSRYLFCIFLKKEDAIYLLTTSYKKLHYETQKIINILLYKTINMRGFIAQIKTPGVSFRLVA
jgi:hypothetical protein